MLRINVLIKFGRKIYLPFIMLYKSYFRKDFEKRMEERERIEEIERLKYRQQLDDKADKEKEKVADFYKDVEKFQVETVVNNS